MIDLLIVSQMQSLMDCGVFLCGFYFCKNFFNESLLANELMIL